MTFRKILIAKPLLEKKVALEFDDGTVAVADFKETAERGGVFAPLNDPKFFRKVKAVQGGRALAWPGELEFCTDALYLESKGAKPPKGATWKASNLKPFSEGDGIKAVRERRKKLKPSK